jgi:hypothetical protein
MTYVETIMTGVRTLSIKRNPPRMSMRVSKATLFVGISVFALSTPIWAKHSLGLRGAHLAPKTYSFQTAGNNYIAPQSYSYYQDPYIMNTATAPTYQNTTQAFGPHSGYVLPSNIQHQLRGPANAARPVALSGPSYRYGPDLRGAQNAARYDMSFVSGAVRTNVRHTTKMLDWQENTTGKTVSLLVNRANGTLAPNTLYIGAGIKGGLMWQSTNTAGQFPILSRFPFFSDRTDKQAGVFAINNAALSFTSTFGDWTTIYLQPEYSETEFRGDQDELQLREAYVVFGNLQKSPFYAAFGRKTIDFGNFDGYNAFTQTEAQHYFWAHSDQPVLELGYYNNGLKLTASAFSGGRQLRTAFAGEENNIGNYAASIEQEFKLGTGGALSLGASYLHDTIYRNNFTAHNIARINAGTPPANFIEYRNSAISGFVEYNSDIFDAMVEYTTTLKPWAAAIPQDIDGNVNPAYLDANGNITFDQNLEVLVAQARFKPMLPNGHRLSIAAVGSWGNIGDDFVGIGIAGQPTSWKKNQQHSLSLEYPVSPYLDFGAEYVYNKGFIPFVSPQLISSNDTQAHAINVGFKARF